MHMQQIQLVKLGDLRHPRGQRQIVRRKLEERIAGDRNLVILNAVVAPAQPEGLRIGDEVNLVAQRGQFDAQFRSHHARTAVGGITRDADAHISSTLADSDSCR